MHKTKQKGMLILAGIEILFFTVPGMGLRIGFSKKQKTDHFSIDTVSLQHKGMLLWISREQIKIF